MSVRTADVAVIGAGIAGAAAAHALAERGVSTVLLETEPQPGHHATGRSAAILSETSGHPVVCALTTASRPFLERAADGFTEHPVLTARGLLWIGREGDDAELDALAGRGRALRSSVRRLSADEARTIVAALRPEAVGAGAVHEPDAMTIDVAELLGGFLRHARRRGAVVRTSAEALTFDRADGCWLIGTADGQLSVATVVNAAGAWGDVVAARAGLRPLGLRPLRRTACIVPAPDTVAHWPMVMDIASRLYFEPEPGGLLLSPADEQPSDPCDARPEELDVALAIDQLEQATGIAVRTVRRTWAGLRTFTPDRAPAIGTDPDEPSFVWLVGQGGAGIKTSPAAARVAAAAVLGEPLPADLAGLGLTRDAISPARFR